MAPFVWMAQALRVGGQTLVSGLATRLGTAASPKAIIAFAKENPTAAFLATKEVADQLGLTDVGAEAFEHARTVWADDVSAASCNVASSHDVTSSHGVGAVLGDAVSSRDAALYVEKSRALEEAFDRIDSARAAVGSLDALENLRKVMSFPAEIMDAYREYRRVR